MEETFCVMNKELIQKWVDSANSTRLPLGFDPKMSFIQFMQWQVLVRDIEIVYPIIDISKIEIINNCLP